MIFVCWLWRALTGLGLLPIKWANATRSIAQNNTIRYDMIQQKLSPSNTHARTHALTNKSSKQSGYTVKHRSAQHSTAQRRNVLMKFLGNLIWNIVLKIRFLSVCCCFVGDQNGESIFMIEKEKKKKNKKKKEKHAPIMCYYEHFGRFRKVCVEKKIFWISISQCYVRKIDGKR